MIIVGFAIPGFLFAILLIILFAGGSFFNIFPLRGLTSDGWAQFPWYWKIIDYFWHITLPLISMALGAFATMTLLTKNSFLDEIRKQYVMTARAKGCSERQVLYNHIFRNAMLIVIAGFPGAFIHAFFSGCRAPGEEGELLVRGPQVFAGYWNRPKETEEALLEGGWFRTGDIVSVDKDDFVTVRDRIKELIITGGFNVSPTEVEDVLSEYPGVPGRVRGGTAPPGRRRRRGGRRRPVRGLRPRPGGAAGVRAGRTWPPTRCRAALPWWMSCRVR